MCVIKKIFSTVNDVNLNRNEGTFAFVLHRLSGLCLAAYIFLHLIVLGSEFLFGKGTFNLLMGTLEWPLFKMLEVCLIAVIAYHLINGTRIVIIDLCRAVKAQKVLFWIVMILTVIVFVITLVVFLQRII